MGFDLRLMRLYATRPSRHEQDHVAMVTSMPLDGQIAWRHHGLMQIKSAEMGRIAPLQQNNGVLLAVENSMPDLNLDPGLDPTTTLSCGLDSSFVLASQRQCGGRQYGPTS